MKKLLLVLCTVLASCGGGGADSPSSSASAVTVRTVNIATYGDSTQQGLDAGALPGVVATNEGMPGTTSSQLLSGTDGKHAPWGDEMAKSPAQIVTINHAINDFQITLAQYQSNLITLVQVAQSHGKLVVIETANPVLPDPPAVPGYDIAAFRSRVQIQREQAAQLGVALCDHYATITNAGMATLQFLPDGVHGTKEVSELRARTLAECLRPLVNQAR